MILPLKWMKTLKFNIFTKSMTSFTHFNLNDFHYRIDEEEEDNFDSESKIERESSYAEESYQNSESAMGTPILF